MYDICRSKYNKKIDSLSAKNKKRLDYKQLKISGDSQYSSGEEQEEQKEQKSIKVDYKTLIKQITDEEKDINNEQNQQKGQGIKILTPNQMFNRLPIALAQLKAGNNSNKLKNEIRQLLYSLYHSKNMTEQVYKSLIGII